MGNKYGIPEDALKNIRARDSKCVYCQKDMIESIQGSWRGDWATIEHLNNIGPLNDPNTVAICCGSCNSSRRNKKLLDWFKTQYCKEKDISAMTVAEPVRNYIKKYEAA